MSGRYLAAAFNARPLGMPVPPNWLALAAFGLLGAFLSPGFLLIGAGLEVAYLAALSRNARFRALVDGKRGGGDGAAAWDARHAALLGRLSREDRVAQDALEQTCEEIVATLEAGAGAAMHEGGLSRLAWLHLRLLSARAALRRIVADAGAEAGALEAQEARLRRRLAEPALDDGLRRSLEQQVAVIDQRQAAHLDARGRLERVEAELERIRQQIKLVREQALLATDEAQAGRSVDALAASLDEASRFVQEEQALLGDLADTAGPPPDDLLRRRRGAQALPTRSTRP
jgi:hypothetical protein